jgi:hypothetical protein
MLNTLKKDKKILTLFVLEFVVFTGGLLYINLFPDFDTDAYAHHCIAREVYLNPLNLNIHWVWLPLVHYIQIPFIALGLSMQVFRYLNLFIVLLIPLVLYRFLATFLPEDEKDVKIFISLAICILTPILILMGTTAQPEPLFCLMILLFGFYFTGKKYFLSSVFLTVAVMLRYEAWIIPAVIIILYLSLYLFSKSKNNLYPGSKWIISLLLPVIAMLAWTILRRISEGVWFGFVLTTNNFANDVLQSSSSFQGGITGFLYDLFYYPVIIPYFFYGPLIILAYLGIKKFYKFNSVIFLIYLSLLSFISLSWIKKSSLGLHRHFMVIVPFAAVLIAYGTDIVANFFYKLKFSKKNIPGEKKLLLLARTKKVFVICVISVQVIITAIWGVSWVNYSRNLFHERFDTADFLKTLPADKTIFCDEASVEVLSGLDMKRFNRKWLENSDAEELIKKTADSEKEIYIVTWDKKAGPLLPLGTLIYTSRPDFNTHQTLKVIKVLK